MQERNQTAFSSTLGLTVRQLDIANNAIWQYRDMYLRPDFYKDNLEKVRVIIAPVIEDSIRNEVPSFNVQVADKLPLEKAMQSHCF